MMHIEYCTHRCAGSLKQTHLDLVDDHWLVGEVNDGFGDRQSERPKPRPIPAIVGKDELAETTKVTG